MMNYQLRENLWHIPHTAESVSLMHPNIEKSDVI